MRINDLEEKTIKQVVPELYEDALHPTLQETGQTMALIPRAINAALAPLRQWIAQKEYNVAETEKLLAIKLQNIGVEKIITPDAYVAVPAIQALSYCIDSEELRELYASLLATSMNEDEKWKVHPSFVEVIKQLSPDEAKLLKRISDENKDQPLIDIRITFPNGGYITEVHNLSLIGNGTCETPDNIYTYLDNLSRLKIIDIPDGVYINNDEIYSKLETYPAVLELLKKPLPEGYKREIVRRKFEMTQYGRSFVEVCLK